MPFVLARGKGVGGTPMLRGAMPPITREQVRQFELLQARCVESLMRPVGDIPDNGQGYAYFENGDVRATLSTNPYAGWATSTFGLTRADSQTINESIGFFRSHDVPAKVRIVPDGFTKEQAAKLAAHGATSPRSGTRWSPANLPDRGTGRRAVISGAGGERRMGGAAPETMKQATKESSIREDESRLLAA